MNADDDVLVSLAAGRAEAVDDVALARARRLLRAPDGLARAYAVLDDVAAVHAAVGVDPDLVARSPLAQLLEREASSSSASSALASSALRTWAAPLSAAAAALAVFILVGDGPVAPRGPGTKGVSLTGTPQVVVAVREVRGPLGEDGVVAGLTPRAAELARCSERDVVVDVRFRVRGDGLVDGADGSARDAAVARCVAHVIAGTAFALHDDATDVDAAVELHPSSGGAP